VEQEENVPQQVLLKQLFDLFIIPEIENRKANGKLADAFILLGAQIIFYADGKKNEVRINSEVQAIADVKLKNGISKQKDENIRYDEIEDIKGIRLTDEDDPDCGHVTLVRMGNTWNIAFDFRYNKSLAKKHIDTADQFYEAAEFSLSKKNLASCLDNLFSAAELASKAVLLLMPDPKFRKKATHGMIQQRYNEYAKLGNVEPDYRDSFNKLSSLRARARYLQGEIPITEEEIRTLCENVKKMILDATERIQTRDKQLVHRLKLKKSSK
jgi:uncharacterized protein (UPF0332 family)